MMTNQGDSLSDNVMALGVVGPRQYLEIGTRYRIRRVLHEPLYDIGEQLRIGVMSFVLWWKKLLWILGYCGNPSTFQAIFCKIRTSPNYRRPMRLLRLVHQGGEEALSLAPEEGTAKAAK